MMKLNKLILTFVILFFCSIVRADLVFDEAICYKDGSLYLSVHSDDTKINIDDIKVIARQKDFFGLTLSKFEVNGSWDKDIISDGKTIFKSGDAQINEAGDYDIILEYAEEGINKNIVYETKCVGLIFSCKLINVDIKNCTNVDDKYFNLLVELSGLNQSRVRQIDLFEDFKYSVVAENKYVDIKDLESYQGSLPKDMKINKINNNLYLFSKEFNNNSILSVNVYLKSLQGECKNSNLYDYQECIRIYTKEITEERNKTEIKEEIEQKEVPKITGETIKISENKSSNKNYLIYIITGTMVLLLIIIIIKKQKINKWV